MDKIIPDDIIDDSLCIHTSIDFKQGILTYWIDAVFSSVDNVTYDINIEHRRDSSIMICRKNDKRFKFYFSPYVSQRYLRFVLPEYAKSKPAINHKLEIISFINKIIQHNLGCEEVTDENLFH
jgi:hypothetical protein